MIKPDLQVSEAYDDNIYATALHPHSDLVSTFDADLSASSLTKFDQIGFAAGALDNDYLRHPSEDSWQAYAKSSAAFTLQDDLQAIGAANFSRLIVPRDNPNGIDGLHPAAYRNYEANGGVVWGGTGRDLLTVIAGFDRQAYDPVPALLGTIDTTERDRDEIYGDVRLDHKFFDQQKIFAELRVNDRPYARAVDNSGFHRSNSGGEADFGSVWDFNGLYLLSATVGYQHQSYDDPRLGTVDTPVARMALTWNPSRMTSVTGTYFHEYLEDIFGRSPGYVHDQFELHVDHELRRNILLGADFSFDDHDLQRLDRSIQVFRYEAKLQYQLPRGYSVHLVYDYSQQNGSEVNSAYSHDVVLLRLKKAF